ncbi:hypothetical protein AFLA_004737 [Aspergillus flavus NRRL3357]|nr:hypothetical protein AFLA_004737 [Aspergillus flavus NRRL3357]
MEIPYASRGNSWGRKRSAVTSKKGFNKRRTIVRLWLDMSYLLSPGLIDPDDLPAHPILELMHLMRVRIRLFVLNSADGRWHHIPWAPLGALVFPKRK